MTAPPSAWGAGWRQRARLLPLWIAMWGADRLGPLVRARPAPRTPWRPGLSVVIPERDAPAMLEEALCALEPALRAVDEPSQVIVVANGAPRSTYDETLSRHPKVELVHDPAPLGFAHAVERGLAQVRHDWVLLLNNDMLVAPDALATLARARGDDVFAIAAQILQRSASGRREETGFTDWYADEEGIHLFHAPVQGEGVVPELCASGGASIFRTALLQRYLPASRAYDPFYWEDAEWSVRAWREGWRVLFAPAARAHHRHRATTSRFYDETELARIVERNRMLFDARHAATPPPLSDLMRRICDLPYASQRELASPRVALGVLRQRLQAHGARQPLPPATLWSPHDGHSSIPDHGYSYRLRSDDGTARKKLLVVTPFAVFPPRHGGARRVAELVRALRTDHDVVLVSDEARLYDARSFAFFDGLRAVELVQRSESADSGRASLEARMASHAHPQLREALAAALRRYRPDLVQVEHAELAGLVEDRTGAQRWVLALHDAVRRGDFDSDAAYHAFEQRMNAFDAVTVCSTEDAVLVQHRCLRVVQNGSAVPVEGYVPSTGSRMLFVGPFRYAPNASGIARFLREAYPAIRAEVPGVELVILGGDEALAATRDEPLFGQPGVRVLGHRDDVAELLRGATLTVNPLLDIRGSAVKVVESLCAGRVCVTTADGARGMHEGGFAGLLAVPTIAQMTAPIVRLLADEAQRHRLERPDVARLAPYRWDACADSARGLYRSLTGATP